MDRRLPRRQRHSLAAAALAAALATLAPASAGAAGFVDPLDKPAAASRLAATGLYNGLARAGSRIVAVGQRGHVVLSDDNGTTWRQAKVPVSSDLVAVTFPTPTRGWAVGHDGVVLRTQDAGATWSPQLDGRVMSKLLGYAHKRLAEQGAENPFLDVWFADERNGFVIGAFNLILRTEDGGHTWQPWLDRTENAGDLHLYAIRRAGGHLFIAGEQGLLMRLDPAAGRFRAIDVPYKGTFFGIVGDESSVVVFGLRGNAFRSTDGGKTWTKVETGVQVGLTAGLHSNGRLVLVSQAGHVLASRDGAAFAPVKVERTTPATAVVDSGPDAVVIAGPRGLRTQSLR